VKLQLEKKERDIDSLKSKFDREESRCHGWLLGLTKKIPIFWEKIQNFCWKFAKNFAIFLEFCYVYCAKMITAMLIKEFAQTW
jgi:hypothetical protein